MSFESINELELPYGSGDDDLLTIVTKFNTRPLRTRVILTNVKCGKGSL